MTTSKAHSRIFYGWIIVATSFVQLTFSAGLAFYGLPVYLRTLNSERGFSISSLSAATSVFWVASGVAGIVVARLLSTTDPRVLIAFGSLVGALSLVGLGKVTALWQVFLVYGLFGLGYCFTAIIVTNTIITRWFHERRSVALSLATTGLSVGGIVATPWAASQLSHRSLGSAFVVIAIVFFVGTLTAPLLFLRPNPASMGTYPDGVAPPTRGSAAVTDVPGTSFSEAIRNPVFAAITAAFALALMAQVGGISQLVKLATERSGKATGDHVLSVLAACSVCGRLIGGATVQRFSTRKFALGALVMQFVGLTVVAFASSSATIYLGAALFGLGVGNVLLLHPLLIAEIFGVRDYARIYGRSQLFVACAIAIGPLLLGWLRDNAGGYRSSYLAAVGINTIAFAIYAGRGEPAPQK